jgi:hypothetical protein
MELFATYCSAQKQITAEDLSALQRYDSDRIRGVHAQAKAVGSRFGILSGQFGLITGTQSLPWYDHLLPEDQVISMVLKVTATLEEWGVSSIRWFSVSFEMDPNVGRYRDVMAQAAAAANIPFEIELWQPAGATHLI